MGAFADFYEAVEAFENSEEGSQQEIEILKAMINLAEEFQHVLNYWSWFDAESGLERMALQKMVQFAKDSDVPSLWEEIEDLLDQIEAQDVFYPEIREIVKEALRPD